MTKDIGVGGNLFGGVMLAWMDEAAGIFAHRYTGGQRMVTLRYTEILFRHPVREGDLVEFYATHPKIGRTSLTFDLKGSVGEYEVFTTSATFVAIDTHGRPVPVEIRRPANNPPT
jgi:acyl-CoA thioesterase YciA